MIEITVSEEQNKLFHEKNIAIANAQQYFEDIIKEYAKKINEAREILEEAIYWAAEEEALPPKKEFKHF